MVADPPVTIDLTGGGPWPAFTLSGVTGPSAGVLNVTYILAPFEVEWTFLGPGGAEVYQSAPNEWTIGDGVTRFIGDGAWPWSVAAWAPEGGGAGSPEFVRALAAPVSLELESAAAVAAVLSTNLTGSNNDLVFTSLLPGRLGNDITVRYLNPGVINAVISVSVSGRDITVSLATNGSAVVTSSATQVRWAIAGKAAAAALVTVANKAANDGSGVVTAMAATDLSGGTGGLPLPPVTLAL